MLNSRKYLEQEKRIGDFHQQMALYVFVLRKYAAFLQLKYDTNEELLKLSSIPFLIVQD